MAQHDYDIANQSGASFRADLNNALSAAATNNSGASAPSTTYAYQWWADTTTGLLKVRNAANTAWVTVGTLASTNLGLATVASPTFTGTPVLGTATGTSLTLTGDLQSASHNGGPLAGMRNRIINGDMRIDQRAAVVTTNATYVTDRWALLITSTGAVQSAQSSEAPSGFNNSLVFDVTSADTSIAAGEYALLYQIIEGLNVADLGWGTASAKTITLSFWIKSTTTGTYCVSLINSAGNRSYVAEYTVSSANTWEYKTILVPGDTSGTWLTNNGIGFNVRFAFAAGSTFQSTAGSWQAGNFLGTSSQTNLLASASNEARITGVQLEPGPVATPFERRSYGQELALCQRYFEKLDGVIQFDGIGGATVTALWPFKVRKRATPVSTTGSTGTVASVGLDAARVTNLSATASWADGSTVNSEL